MSSIHELLKQVYPLKLRMELFNAIWFNWQADIKEKDQQITDLQNQLAITEKALEFACETLQDINFKLYNTEMNFVDFFKQQAKERLENE